jgi:drug/metabolite transporter (DMT)-like permease
MQSQKIKGYIAAAISAISFGLIPLFVVPIKQAGISMDVTLFYRFILGAALIGIYMLIRSKSFRLTSIEIPKLAVMGVLYALSSEFLFLGYDLMSAGIASTLIYTYPIIIAVILAVVFRERISSATKGSITLATMGVVCMSWEGEQMSFNTTGVVIVMLGSLSYALYMLIVNKGKLSASGMTITFYSMLFSGLFYALKSGVNGQNFELPSSYWLWFIASFSLVTTVLSVLAMVVAINLIGSTPTAVLGALEPVVAVWLSVLFLGEKATWNLFTGLVFVMAALLVNVLARKQK